MSYETDPLVGSAEPYEGEVHPFFQDDEPSGWFGGSGSSKGSSRTRGLANGGSESNAGSQKKCALGVCGCLGLVGAAFASIYAIINPQPDNSSSKIDSGSGSGSGSGWGPGFPGGGGNTIDPLDPGEVPQHAWTLDEAMIVKAKLNRIYSMTKAPVGGQVALIAGPDWKNTNMEEIVGSMGRFTPTAIRLGFHGCLLDRDGTGGCDGCLYADGMDRVFMDYVSQKVVPYSGPTAPNFNDGLKPVCDILEEMYTNKDYPSDAPSLNVSLYDSGKSRADFWAFAAATAVEHSIVANNMVCHNPNYEYPVKYPDSLESNSFWGKHCTQTQGTPECYVKMTNRIVFKTGRSDCKQPQLYQLEKGSSCPKGLDILTERDCQAAGKEQNVQTQFSPESEVASCKGTGVKDGRAMCYMSVRQKYNSGPSYWVWNPLGLRIPLRPCREDLNITDEADCKNAAKYLYLPYMGDGTSKKSIPNLDVSGCYVGAELLWGGRFRWVVVWNTGKPFPPGPSRRDIRSICHTPHQRVKGYMASQWGQNPANQGNGSHTVEFFRTQFGLNPRESVALMGAHTVGRFHARASLYRYIWVRSGGMMFNNEYFRNIAGRPGYRFLDDCAKIGNAYGKPGAVRWDADRRGEQTNTGPITWVLMRHVCTRDCSILSEEKKAADKCCQDMPEGGMCNPSCDKWFTESGMHELMLPSEIGLFYKFSVNKSDEQPSGCSGFANFARGSCSWFTGPGDCKPGPADCPLNDEPATGNMKMHEVVELFADNQDLWVKEFNDVFTKVLSNGYGSTLVEGPDATTDVVCPIQNNGLTRSAYYWTCFHTSQLSEPFFLISEKDNAHLELNNITGRFQLAPTSGQKNQKWYYAHTSYGKQLVNGWMEFGVGNIVYNETTKYVQNTKGCVARGWNGYALNWKSPFDGAPWTQQLYRYKMLGVDEALPTPAPTTPSPEGCVWSCYLDRYSDLKKAFGTNFAAAADHYQKNGKREGRDCTCEGTKTPVPTPAPVPEPPRTSTLEAASVNVAGTGSFGISSANVQAKVWNDRDYNFLTLSPDLEGATLFQGPVRIPNGDVLTLECGTGGGAFYALVDEGRGDAFPAELKSEGWTLTTDSFATWGDQTVGEKNFDVYTKPGCDTTVKSSGDDVVATFLHVTGSPSVSATSGSFGISTANERGQIWNDRDYTFSTLSSDLQGATLFQGPVRIPDGDILTMNCGTGGGTFYALVAQHRGAGLVAELESEGWTLTTSSFASWRDSPFDVYSTSGCDTSVTSSGDDAVATFLHHHS